MTASTGPRAARHLLLLLWVAVAPFLVGHTVLGATSLEAFVKDQDGVPIAAAMVSARARTEGATVVQAVTDQAGQFRIATGDAAPFDLRIEKPGFYPHTALVGASGSLSAAGYGNSTFTLFRVIGPGPGTMLPLPNTGPNYPLIGFALLVVALAGWTLKRFRRKNRRVFVSYRHGDAEHVTGRIVERLVRQYSERRVFRDLERLKPGHDFRQQIADQIAKSDVMLAIVGPGWLEPETATTESSRGPSDYIVIELETALKQGVRIVPVLVDDAEMPGADVLPQSLKDFPYLHGVQVRADPDFRTDMDRLITSLGA